VKDILRAMKTSPLARAIRLPAILASIILGGLILWVAPFDLYDDDRRFVAVRFQRA
jgi:hypothetical protein